MKRIAGLIAMLALHAPAPRAQTCPVAGGLAIGTGDLSITDGQSVCFDQAFSIGDNVTLSGLTVGNLYTVDVCGEPAPSNHPAPYDSYIGVWDAAGTSFVDESSGGSCGDGNDETITFEATASSHLAILRSEACGTGFQLHDLCVTNEGPVPVELQQFSVD